MHCTVPGPLQNTSRRGSVIEQLHLPLQFLASCPKWKGFAQLQDKYGISSALGTFRANHRFRGNLPFFHGRLRKVRKKTNVVWTNGYSSKSGKNTNRKPLLVHCFLWKPHLSLYIHTVCSSKKNTLYPHLIASCWSSPVCTPCLVRSAIYF